MSTESAFGLLQSLTIGAPEERLTVHDINDAMGERAFGIVLLLFTLPNCFPIPGPPFLSTLTGLPVVIFAAQLAFGATHPYLPQRLQRFSITRGSLASILKRAEPYWRKIEKAFQPRWLPLVNGGHEKFVGFMALVMAILLSLPIPLGNLLPAVALALLSLGLIQKDGGAVAMGYGLTAIAVGWIGFIFYSGEKIFNWFHHFFF